MPIPIKSKTNKITQTKLSACTFGNVVSYFKNKEDKLNMAKCAVSGFCSFQLLTVYILCPGENSAAHKDRKQNYFLEVLVLNNLCWLKPSRMLTYLVFYGKQDLSLYYIESPLSGSISVN